MTSRNRIQEIPKGNQNPYIEEEQTTQWPREKVQKEKQRSIKHTHKIKDRVTRTQLKTERDKRNIYMVIGHTDIPFRLTRS